MREYLVSTLVLLFPLPLAAQAVPADWKVVRDARNMCQIAAPPDWSALAGSTGAAILRDPTTAIAVVTSQPGQEHRPLTAVQLKMMGVPKEKVFENSATRVFYQHKTSEGRDDPNAFSATVPAKDGMCSCHVTAQTVVTEEVVRKIVLTLAPAAGKT